MRKPTHSNVNESSIELIAESRTSAKKLTDEDMIKKSAVNEGLLISREHISPVELPRYLSSYQAKFLGAFTLNEIPFVTPFVWVRPSSPLIIE